MHLSLKSLGFWHLIFPAWAGRHDIWPGLLASGPSSALSFLHRARTTAHRDPSAIFPGASFAAPRKGAASCTQHSGAQPLCQLGPTATAVPGSICRVTTEQLPSRTSGLLSQTQCLSQTSGFGLRTGCKDSGQDSGAMNQTSRSLGQIPGHLNGTQGPLSGITWTLSGPSPRALGAWQIFLWELQTWAPATPTSSLEVSFPSPSPWTIHTLLSFAHLTHPHGPAPTPAS